MPARDSCVPAAARWSLSRTLTDFQQLKSFKPLPKVDEKILRILDANLNRAKEALRVCEDIARFILDEKKTTEQYKRIRHQVTEVFSAPRIARLLKARDILRDVGKDSIPSEFRRKNAKDIFYANSQRAKESMRVLEEFGKLLDKKSGEQLKKTRYQIYELERSVAEKL